MMIFFFHSNITVLKEFLETSEKQLQRCFNSACNFLNIQSYLMDQSDSIVTEVASMKVAAGNLLKIAPTFSGNMINTRL